MLFFLIIGVILGATSVIFALQNTVVVPVSFFAWSMDGSLSVILLAAMLIGVLICTLFTIPEVIITHFRFRRLNKENKRLVDELAKQQQVIDQKDAQLATQSNQQDTVVEKKVTTETTSQSTL